MRPLSEEDASDWGQASPGSFECIVEVPISFAGVINLVLPSGQLLLGEIIVVMTCGIWKSAHMFPCASHRDSPLLTLLGGRWLLMNLPLGPEQDWAEVGKKNRMWPPSLELGGPVELARPSQAQARVLATWPRVSPQADNLSGRSSKEQ